MITILSALVSLLSFRVRSRASLELEVVALRHQVAVLRRQRSGRLRLFCADRLLWVWLYRIWPRALHAMVLVKPATVVQWHRRGFRLYWRWRSRSRQIGRPKTSTEIRQLIRQMSMANPIWGAPRIHGELLMLGIEVSQATVGRYMPWRPKVPSPTWRSFLRNHMRNMAAVDMFVVATATFRLLYALIVLGHDRRRIIHFEVTQNPTQVWLARQMTEAFPCRRVSPARCAVIIFSVLSPDQDASLARQGLSGHPASTPTCCGQDHRVARGRRTASSLRTSRRLSSHRDDAGSRSGVKAGFVCDQSTRCNHAQHPRKALRS